MLSQLGNKVQHGLRAYTPADQKAVRAAAESFRANPGFNTYETILNLGTGEAVASFLGEDGIPSICQKVYVLPPKSRFGAISDAERDASVKGSLLYGKYANAVDPDSAYEFLERRGLQIQKEKEEAAAAAAAAKEAAAAAKAAEKEAAAREAQKKRAAKSVASTVAGTVGREAGKAVGKNFGVFGKTVGGNLGASLGRGILSTLFRV